MLQNLINIVGVILKLGISSGSRERERRKKGERKIIIA